MFSRYGNKDLQKKVEEIEKTARAIGGFSLNMNEFLKEGQLSQLQAGPCSVGIIQYWRSVRDSNPLDPADNRT